MKIRPIISSTLCMLMLVAGSVGCAPKRVDPTLSRAPQQPNPDGARALLRSGGDTADWGLALSGGGLRAALFGIGVMKALYDAGVLQKVDAISSVSGGGYASMWLYRKQNAEPSAAGGFGSSALDDGVFAKSLCELEEEGNFHPYGVIVANLRGGSFAGYERSLNRTFGVDTSASMPIHALRAMIDRGDAPQFIHNATLADTAQLAPVRFDNIVEMTSWYIGNPRFGYHEWEREPARAPRWSEAVTTAAAALRPLSHRIHWPTSTLGDSVLLWDGGKSENLAAFALIRRRMPNVVIVDAEHDPEYAFEGYERLKHLLPAYGLSMAVEDIDRHLGNRDKDLPHTRAYASGPVSIGAVRAILPDGSVGPVTSTIHYIKLSVSRAVQEKMQDSALIVAGVAYDEKLEAANSCEAKASVAGGFDPKSFVYEVSDYWQWSRGQSRISWATRKLPVLRSKAARYEFPQTTTLDQSFFMDQTDAFIGLGYLQASTHRW